MWPILVHIFHNVTVSAWSLYFDCRGGCGASCHYWLGDVWPSVTVRPIGPTSRFIERTTDGWCWSAMMSAVEASGIGVVSYWALGHPPPTLGNFYLHIYPVGRGRPRPVANTTHFHVPATYLQLLNPLECKVNSVTLNIGDGNRNKPEQNEPNILGRTEPN